MRLLITLKKKLLFLLLLSTLTTNAQQESIIKIDSGSNNNVTVEQNKDDSLQKSNIELKNTDSNTIQVTQKAANLTSKGVVTNIKDWITDANNLFGLLVSLITLAGFIWKGIPFIRKIIRKQ